ncbi:MAG: hypothetical protein ACD_19C00014G0033 [uncultured bacterium]|nr:MAG: hypothetical protein ACD_19C00014G0033 [uncultured bacterium]
MTEFGKNPGAGPSFLKINGPVFAPDKGGGGGDPDMEKILQENMLMGLFGGRERGYAEIIETDLKPEKIRVAQRSLSANMERMYYEDQSDQIGFIVQRMIMPSLYDRISALTTTKPIFDDWSDKEKKGKINSDEGLRNELVVELTSTKRELQARQNLVARINEERAFEGDVEEYTVSYFLRGFKQSMDAKHYGTIFNSKETFKGMEAYGEKVETAMGLWKRVAEGNAKVIVRDSDGVVQERRLPNVFALPRNKGLFDAVIENYVVPSIKRSNVGRDHNGKEKAVLKLEEEDCRSAAITALLLMWHWDLDVEYGVGKNGYMSDVVSPEDLANLTHEIINDLGKISYAEQRRASEWRGKPNVKEGMREHPRAVGSPSTLGCLPRLTRSALHLMSTEVKAEKFIKDENGLFKKVDIVYKYETDPKGRLIMEDGQPKIAKNKETGKLETVDKINVSIADAVWSKGKVKRSENGNVVEWRFSPVKFKNILWDDVRFLNGENKIVSIEPVLMSDLTPEQIADIKSLKLIDFQSGVATNAIEVPYKLQAFLAYNYVFKHFMRTDYGKLYEEITKNDLLIKMNKGIDNALGLLQTAYNLDQELTQKLNDYLRVVFLGGLGASVIQRAANGVPEGANLENKAQTNQDISSMRKNDFDTNIKGAAKACNFLTFKDSVLDEKQSQLFKHIIEKGRKAPTPFELRKMDDPILKDWFTEDELVILSAMYPLETPPVSI